MNVKMVNDLCAYSFPWRVLVEDGQEGFSIVDANGDEVMYVPDFTGDGAVVNLTEQQARQMVTLLNTTVEGST